MFVKVCLMPMEIDFKKLYEDYESKEVCLLNKLTLKIYGLRFWNARLKEEHLIFFIKMLPNKKSNQKNLGVIKSSNLCCEIMEYSNHEETAVCNLQVFVFHLI